MTWIWGSTEGVDEVRAFATPLIKPDNTQKFQIMV